MGPNLQPNATADDEFAVALGQHLDREEAALAGLLRAVQDVRAVLLQNDANGLMAGLARQAQAFGSLEQLRAERQKLARNTAMAADMPGTTPTLSTLAGRLPAAVRGTLQARCQRLRRLAGEVDRVNAANHLFVLHMLGMMEQLLLDLTGGEPAGQGYGRTGTPKANVYGRLVEARG